MLETLQRWRQFRPLRPRCALRRACALCGLVLGVVFVSGCAQYHVDRLANSSLGTNRVNDIWKLKKYNDQASVQTAIINALQDECWPVRHFAVTAISEFELNDPQLKLAACRSLVRLLDDDSGGEFCIRSGPRYVLYGLPPLREAAHKRLTLITDKDFGYKKDRWDEYFCSLEPE